MTDETQDQPSSLGEGKPVEWSESAKLARDARAYMAEEPTKLERAIARRKAESEDFRRGFDRAREELARIEQHPEDCDCARCEDARRRWGPDEDDVVKPPVSPAAVEIIDDLAQKPGLSVRSRPLWQQILDGAEAGRHAASPYRPCRVFQQAVAAGPEAIATARALLDGWDGSFEELLETAVRLTERD